MSWPEAVQTLCYLNLYSVLETPYLNEDIIFLVIMNDWFQSRCPPGHWAVSGHIFNCHKWRRCRWILVTRGQGCCAISYSAQGTPPRHDKELPPLKYHNAKIEKPYHKLIIFSPKGFCLLLIKNIFIIPKPICLILIQQMIFKPIEVI